MDVTEIARSLNQRRTSAAPCAWLPAISIFIDEDYENYDYDLIGPRTRLRLIKLLEQSGFRHVSGNLLEGPPGRLEFPRPPRSLSADPGDELDKVVNRGSSVAIATPTQIVLVTVRREGPELSGGRRADLVALVREQPANLDKIEDLLGRSGLAAAFRQLRPALEAAQREGVEQRRRGVFRSRLPR